MDNKQPKVNITRDWHFLVRDSDMLAVRLEADSVPPPDLMEELCLAALLHARMKSLALLLSAGAPPTSRLFLEASRHYEKDAMSLLLAAGADINSADPETGNTALHYAALTSDWSAMLWIASKGARWSSKNLQGKIPFDFFKPSSRQCSSEFFASFAAEAHRQVMDELVSVAPVKPTLRL
jgi:hypothetical protein